MRYLDRESGLSTPLSHQFLSDFQHAKVTEPKEKATQGVASIPCLSEALKHCCQVAQPEGCRCL